VSDGGDRDAVVITSRLREPTTETQFATIPIERSDLALSVSATGRLQASATIEVGAEVSGRIIELPVEANDRVSKGQVLARIDPEPLRSALEQADAQARVARANERVALATKREQRQLASRNTALADQQLISEQVADSALASAARADASYDAAVSSTRLAEASVSHARTQLARATIRSPIDGVVLARKIEPGQTVTAGFTTPVLFKLAEDLGRMTLKLDVDEADVARLRAGQIAGFTVDAFPGRTFESRVRVIRDEPTISQNVVTYEVVLDVENADHSLKPGMTATASIATARRVGVIVVPNAALRFSLLPDLSGIESPRAWLAERGHAPRPHILRLGLSDGTRTEVLSGLEVGDTVVVGWAR
jgi:HlyD family secretion protein